MNLAVFHTSRFLDLLFSISYDVLLAQIVVYMYLLG